jgi:hypothetical protein
MKYNYEIKIFNNSFNVFESRNEFVGLRKKWTKQQLLLTEYPYRGYSEIGITSWKRCKDWLKNNHPELLI